MLECDAVLAKMQEMLFGFQKDLGEISDDIRHLQDESHSMNIKLKNRRSTEDLIHKFVENITIDPEVPGIINSVPVNEEFLEAVIALGKTLKYLNQTDPSRDGSSLDKIPSETYAGKELLPELEKLKNRAISKIRDHFIQQFQAMRKPKTNVQMVQQNSLVRYSQLLLFLQQESTATFDEIK